jgi:hypothetical protein
MLSFNEMLNRILYPSQPPSPAPAPAPQPPAPVSPAGIDRFGTAKVSHYTIRPGDDGRHFTTVGAHSPVIFTMPRATVGLLFAVTRSHHDTVQLVCQVGDDFRGHPAKLMELAEEGATIVVKCMENGFWTVQSAAGLTIWQ